MLSLRTCIELVNVVDDYVLKVVDRLFTALDLTHLANPNLGKFTKDDKINILLKTLKYPPSKAQISDSFQLDVLQFMIDHFYRYEDDEGSNAYIGYDPNFGTVTYDDKFSYKYPSLANSLKLDGYIIKGRTIKKMLPNEIEEAKTENELFTLLRQYEFDITKGHLEQAIKNHSQGNWAGANSQFRPFVESLLIDIAKKLAPNNKCESASSAINILSKSVNPPFLRADLNEVESNNCNKPFIEGFWKRLHPEGNHPGLSSEEDSTFRYHISIVIAHYLLKRLSNWA